MKTYTLQTKYRQLLADTVTPVGIYLQLRDKYRNCLLLESSDYHGHENSFTYICCEPIAEFRLKDSVLRQSYPDGTVEEQELVEKREAVALLQAYCGKFKSEQGPFGFIQNGLFGYMSFEAVQYYEQLNLRQKETAHPEMPEILYQAFRFVIAIDHFKNQLYIFEHSLENAPETDGLDELETNIRNKNIPSFHFSTTGQETTNFTDEEFLRVIEEGKRHCHLGNVFQIVLSRRFSQGFQGDEFNVYRALRSINPSPYLFFFDYGNFKIFGSSPEAQLTIKKDTATIFPIAGTFKRTGNDLQDAELAQKLYDDPKENSEHVMLVDLARNDLSRHGDQVKVEVFKEVQYYSHVIHLVSKVTAQLSNPQGSVQMVADTFPAGTLSGAPKHRALTLIDELEPTGRGFYGGCLGYLGFGGDFNHAIMIRSFMSVKNKLYFQAGAGVVAKSDTHSELNEVHHKLAALRKALEKAATI
ncbi:anthranilate synthase component I family protein [Rufibacter glacialis]|uniref:Anthranilate synthase component 1 n=1 Tax=Rufibacter glacialis TaxID=1259555 RepID=A0A5M8QHQ1_9BACT|nr:anthranilate synthase component I family protein [Rufibacter glacialis]KAA6434460.1 anthranilate synthase component I family protein [Rufibacter glacialis]GGK69818.1 anthranilate synthase component I [Rufibacter glacialis]